jgi:hypothetical protein
MWLQLKNKRFHSKSQVRTGLDLDERVVFCLLSDWEHEFKLELRMTFLALSMEYKMSWLQHSQLGSLLCWRWLLCLATVIFALGLEFVIRLLLWLLFFLGRIKPFEAIIALHLLVAAIGVLLFLDKGMLI